MSQVNVLPKKHTHIPVLVDSSLPVGRPTSLLDRTNLLNPVPSPFLRPPVEIISRIIELGAEDDSRNFPILVSHICARLRLITLDNPLLWNSIVFVGGKSSYHEVETRLQRSKDASIDIVVSNIPDLHNAENMLRILYPHVARWRSLDLEVWDTVPADAVMEALIDEAPRLEELSLRGLTSRPFHPFSGKTPVLQSLVVKSMPLVWESPLFHALTSLNIHSASWTSASLLRQWQKLKTLVIRADSSQTSAFDFPDTPISLPDLHCLELNGVTEEEIVLLLTSVEMPSLRRMLFTHIKDSPNPVRGSIFPLPRVKSLRLHATEMCQDNLLHVLRSLPNLDSISFEDSSPIPTFIKELTPSACPKTWVCGNVSHFKVVAFEKDNAHRLYDDTDIMEALKVMMHQRRSVKEMAIRMCVFEGQRDDVTRHASPWGVERPYISEKNITVDS